MMIYHQGSALISITGDTKSAQCSGRGIGQLTYFLTTINYIRAHTPYPNDDPLLRIWNDELEKLLATIQGEIITTGLSSATPEDLDKFVKALIRYLRHL